MSVKSVRAAVTSAVKDSKVTLAEAQNITHIAGRTKGIDAGERRELVKATLSRSRFDVSAMNHLRANAAPPPTASTPTVKALTQVVNARGLDAISGLKDADEARFSPGLKSGLERFASILNNQDGDSIGGGVRELVVGKRKLFVAADFDWDKGKELIGFFDGNGKEVARAALTAKEGSANLTMNWETIDGRSVKDAIGSPTQRVETKVPPNFAKDLEAFVKAKNGDGLGGKDLEAKDMPAMIRRRYEHMERNIPDGVGAEKLNFKGVPLYVLHDYSCVSSAHFFTEDGKRHFVDVG